MKEKLKINPVVMDELKSAVALETLCNPENLSLRILEEPHCSCCNIRLTPDREELDEEEDVLVEVDDLKFTIDKDFWEKVTYIEIGLNSDRTGFTVSHALRSHI